MTKRSYLIDLFTKASENISDGNWSLEIVNTKVFRNNVLKNRMSLFSDEDAFEQLEIFDKNNVDEYAVDFLLYKWLKDHDDKRYRNFSFVIRPHNRQFDMREVSFEDIMHFVSPETKKTSGNEANISNGEKQLAEKFKKVFGEVFTPTKLVNEMLDKLPEEVWSDPTKTWLDPSCGTGNFLLEVYRRLMDSLVDIIPNEQERKKHILENQIHGVELQERNVILCNMRLDPNDEYDIHIDCADALEFNYWKK